MKLAVCREDQIHDAVITGRLDHAITLLVSEKNRQSYNNDLYESLKSDPLFSAAYEAGDSEVMQKIANRTLTQYAYLKANKKYGIETNIMHARGVDEGEEGTNEPITRSPDVWEEMSSNEKITSETLYVDREIDYPLSYQKTLEEFPHVKKWALEKIKYNAETKEFFWVDLNLIVTAHDLLLSEVDGSVYRSLSVARDNDKRFTEIEAIMDTVPFNTERARATFFGNIMGMNGHYLTGNIDLEPYGTYDDKSVWVFRDYLGRKGNSRNIKDSQLKARGVRAG